MNERERYNFFLEKTRDLPRETVEDIDYIIFYAQKLDVPEISMVEKDYDVYDYATNLELGEKKLAAHFEITGFLENDGIEIDQSWKDRLYTYLEHIKATVRTHIPDGRKKDAILRKIQLLEEELDTQKVRFERIGDLWLSLTGYIGEGATNLLPVTKLLGKMHNSLNQAEKKAEEKQKMLPSPEDVGLGDLEDEAAE